MSGLILFLIVNLVYGAYQIVSIMWFGLSRWIYVSQHFLSDRKGGQIFKRHPVFTSLVTGASLKNERRCERWDNTTSRHKKRHEMTPEKRAIFGGF